MYLPQLGRTGFQPGRQEGTEVGLYCSVLFVPL